MAYQVLARKWRPQVFQDVIGQEHITQTLMNAIREGRLAHAYLFGGPRGIGKTSVARIFAKAINCRDGEPGIPCNQCRSCMEITDGSSVDVQEIDGASNRGIDEIRELRENVKYMPASSNYRIYIIDEVHMLTTHAFNALLKTLEEPPAHAKFIFATTEPHKVPVTILSRCQRFDFRKIPYAKIISHLQKIAEEENIEISKAGLSLIARESEGCMRDAQSLLDQVVSFAGRKPDDSQVIEILGIIDRDILFETSRAVLENSPDRCLDIVDRIFNYGYDIRKFYSALMGQFRNLLVSDLAPQPHLLDLSEEETQTARQQAEQAGTEKLQIILNYMIRREQDLRFSSDPRLILESILIRLCRLGDYLSFGDLMKKISALEKALLTASSLSLPEAGDHISEPVAPWVSEKPEQSDEIHEESHATPENNDVILGSWNDFLNFVKTRNHAMFNILKGWKFLGLKGNRIELEKSSQAFSADFFDDREAYGQLTSFFRDFCRKDVQIIIHPNKHSAAMENRRPDSGSAGEADPPDPMDIPPPVQDILDMFQGEIRTDYDRK